MDELAFGITGENVHYGTPINLQLLAHVPGGSSSGSAVAVAAKLVDFALGTDTVGCVRIPAAYCNILGYRPSHGSVSTIGVLLNSQSLDTVGLLARDPSILHRVGQLLLEACPTPTTVKRGRRFIFADDIFQYARIPKQKSMHVIGKAIDGLSGYQLAKHLNVSQYIASNVPSLKEFCKPLTKLHQGTSTLQALSTVMISLQKYEFKTNHEEWINTIKPRFGHEVSARVLAALNSSHDNVKSLYKVRAEFRAALNSLLKDDGILVIPTIPDIPAKLSWNKKMSNEFEDRLFIMLSIAGLSGCCQVNIPVGKHDGYPISISLIASHGADKFLLDTVLDIHSSLQEQINIASNMAPLPDFNGDMDTSELLKEKNVKAYLRRGTAREMLLSYKEAFEDFKHALVLEPQNKVARCAEKRLKRTMS
ncbi:hypothetical protein HPP92_016785 [Vanilla planifolia]|uniref:Amidase domain-containing protein n=1 Tax=Vanilla planifolia TaxID=51239 RepID=A0A835QGD5_VANPL|nr:hypothetical protein HPP92_016785 [Vanilla planifolia]